MTATTNIKTVLERPGTSANIVDTFILCKIDSKVLYLGRLYMPCKKCVKTLSLPILVIITRGL